MKIGLFADPHYSDKKASGNRLNSLSYGKIKDAMTSFKEHKVDLVICLGDLTDDCIDIKDNPKILKELTEMINSFGIEFYSLMGNHDCQSFTKEEFKIFSGGAYPPFKIENDNAVLIFLDCNYTDNGEKYKVGNVDWTNTYLPKTQFEALKKALNTEKEKYVFVHQNLDKGVEEHHIVHNAEEIRKIIEEAHVNMVIQGHYHLGHNNLINSVKYHTLPAMCEGERNHFEILII